MRIVISEFMDESALNGFPRTADILYDPDLVDDRARLLGELANADAIIVRNRTQVDRELIDAAPKLRAIGRLGVGLDNIDIKACEARRVAVLPATGANALSVAEYVIAVTLMLVRGAYFSNAAILDGKWPRNALIKGEISGRVMGLIGFGSVARTVAAHARALGMTIVAHDPYLSENAPAWDGVRRCDTLTLLEISDVVSLHVPLTKETHGLIDAQTLAVMKPTAILINTARGGIVDESALAGALKAGKLAGAALDVFKTEPLTQEAALVFKDVPNLILTPHIAGVTRESDIRVSAVTVANVRKTLAD